MDRITVFALFFRILIAFSTRTFFQPDEYFQSLEPAHQLVFGYGQLTWEWLTTAPIRSISYPALNVPIYWVLKLTGLDDGWLLILAPKILHGAIAALTDMCVCKVTKRVLGERYVSTAFFLSLSSFFHTLSLSRSLSNSAETALTTIAFVYFPWETQTCSRSNIRTMLSFAALACIIRPTNVVIWAYQLGNLAWRLRYQKFALTRLALDSAAIGTVSLISLFILDTIYYGRPTFTPLNFLLTNLSPVSLFYGSSPAHYYLSQAFPILCTTALPFVLHGAWLAIAQNDEKLRIVLGCVVWTVAVYSTAGHKEWRFLHPLLPLMHILAAKSLVDAFRIPTNSAQPKKLQKDNKSVLHIRSPVLVLLLLTAPASFYVIFFHCSAQISVMRFLRALPPSELHSVGFLMPCHSTPGHAHLHREELAQEGRMWALGCEPPLGLGIEDLANYQDQTDVFYDSPLSYLIENFPLSVDPSFPPSPKPSSRPGIHERDWEHEWPQHLVMFGALLETNYGVRELLQEKGYGEIWKAGWEWEGEGKRKGGVRVWKYLTG